MTDAAQLSLFGPDQSARDQLAADAWDRLLDAFASLTLGHENWKYAKTQIWHANRLADEALNA